MASPPYRNPTKPPMRGTYIETTCIEDEFRTFLQVELEPARFEFEWEDPRSDNYDPLRVLREAKA